MSTQERLLRLIKAKNPLAATLSVSALVFGEPETITGSKNTQLTIAAAVGSGYTGAVTVRYNRHDLAELEPVSSVAVEGVVTLSSILARLNQLAQTDLTEADFEPPHIPTFIFGVVNTITLKAAPTSLGWTGQVRMEILRIRTEQDKLDQVVSAVIGVQEEVRWLEDLLGVGESSVEVMLQANKFNNTTDDFFLGQPVYAVGPVGMALAKADAAATSTVVGLVASTIVESGGGEGKIQSLGVLTGTIAQWEFATGMVGGLVPNKPYFLDPEVKGRITPFNLNFVDGQYLTCVGIAISSTQLSINIERPISL